jgi:hypothetical protein
MIRSLIVYGPAGCGKTRNAKLIMEYFGLSRIVDEGVCRITEIDCYGSLYLMQTPPPLAKRNGARSRSFDQIKDVIGKAIK